MSPATSEDHPIAACTHTQGCPCGMGRPGLQPGRYQRLRPGGPPAPTRYNMPGPDRTGGTAAVDGPIGIHRCRRYRPPRVTTRSTNHGTYRLPLNGAGVNRIRRYRLRPELHGWRRAEPTGAGRYRALPSHGFDALIGAGYLNRKGPCAQTGSHLRRRRYRSSTARRCDRSKVVTNGPQSSTLLPWRRRRPGTASQTSGLSMASETKAAIISKAASSLGSGPVIRKFLNTTSPSAVAATSPRMSSMRTASLPYRRIRTTQCAERACSSRSR